jgi:hypothetical protein
MAFYKYGLAFLAGTGFGAVMTSVHREICPLHRQRCLLYRRWYADDYDMPPEAEDKDDSNVRSSRRPKKAGKRKEKKKDSLEESE